MRPAAARPRPRGAAGRTRSSPTSSTCRWRRRSSPPPRRAACARSTASACCCTRRCPASRAGSASRPRSRRTLRALDRRPISRAADDLRARPHRLDRHGQDHDRRDVPRARRAGPRRRRRRARALSRRGRAADRGGLSRARRATASSTARRSAPLVLGDPERARARSRRSSTRWSRASEDGVPRASARPQARRSRCSTSRSCSRPAARRAATRSLVVTAPAEVQRARVLARPGMTEEKFAADPAPSRCPTPRSGAGPFPRGHRPRLRCGGARRCALSCAALAGRPGRGRCERRIAGDPRQHAARDRPRHRDHRHRSGRAATGSIEIGCVELLNHIPTGRTFHRYINPQRPVSAGRARGARPVGRVPAPTSRSSRRSPTSSWTSSATAGSSIHNAAFDVGFLNAELARIGPPAARSWTASSTPWRWRGASIPAPPNSLDALCARYGIDNSRRTKHGALLDAEILAEVYIELIGGKQADLGLSVRSGERAIRPRGRGGRSPRRSRGLHR